MYASFVPVIFTFNFVIIMIVMTVVVAVGKENPDFKPGQTELVSLARQFV